LQRQLARARAKEAEARAETEALEAAIAKLTAAREALALAEDELTLRAVPSASTVTGNMVTDRRLAISKGRTGKDKFAAAYRKAGYTLRSLAAAVGCSHTMLSMHRTDSDRKIPRERAEAIAELIDWPADRAHWPHGFAS
jgi:hypothetical protein